MGPSAFVLRTMRLALVLCVLALSGCKTLLHASLTEQEANVIIALLDSFGIDAVKEVDARSKLASVMVDENQFSMAVEILEMNGLPEKNFATIDQVFSGEGLVTTPTEERARLHFAISQELSRSISELDGVLSARVHVVMPEEANLVGFSEQNQSQATASVLVRRRPEVPLENLVPNIKRFVSSSIQYLDYEDVAVIDFVVPVDIAVTNRVSPPDQAQDTAPISWANVTIIGLLTLIIAAFVILNFGNTLRHAVSQRLGAGRTADTKSGDQEADVVVLPQRNLTTD